MLGVPHRGKIAPNSLLELWISLGQRIQKMMVDLENVQEAIVSDQGFLGVHEESDHFREALQV